MELQPHKDMIRKNGRNRGYAIRIGRQIPENSANLAYMSSKSLSPDENILLEDLSSQIKENGISSFIERDYLVYPNTEFLLESETGQSVFPTDTVSITDEFSIRKNRQDTPKPVFYKMELKGRFDIRNSEVIAYQGGYTVLTEQEAVPFEEIKPDKRNELVYLGDAIRIEANGRTLSNNEIYKIKLIQDSGFLYRIVVFTNFENAKETTYRVAYPSYNNDLQKSESKEEVLNAYPFFEQVTKEQFKEIVKEIELNPDAYKELKVYTIEQNGSNFSFYATSDLMIANYQTRMPQLFKHRVEAELKTKLSETNPGELKVGFFFVQDAPFVENITSAGQSIYQSNLLPSYLNIINPHTIEPDLLKDDLRYWHIDFDMPEHHYEDYDMIIISGYGKIDLSMYKDKFIHYLENGGTIFVDNAGSGTKRLDFITTKGNTFVTDISFSESTNEFGIRESIEDSAYENRLYSIEKIDKIGYPDTSPVIVFGENEPETQWTTLIGHLKGGPSIIRKQFFERGQIIVSNAGILRSVYHKQKENMYFIMNMFLHHAENKWLFTPWRNEFVYNKENLFDQEYKVNGADVYINDRNDYDANQIVAKKMLAPNIRDYVKTFSDPWFFNAVGTYHHHIDGDREIPTNNRSFESGQVTEQGEPITEWTTNKVNAIPGWNTKKLAGELATFTHDYDTSMFGARQVSLNVVNRATGSHSFWESEAIYLSKDDYRASVWISVNGVKGITTDGAKIGVYDSKGKKIAASVSATGKRDRVKLNIAFHIKQPQLINVRLGFVDGNGTGKVSFDNFNLESIGTVKGVIENKGEKALYAFSTKPNSTTIDVAAEGFGDANITRIAPTVPFSFTITPFIYEWVSFGVDTATGLEVGRYERKYGSNFSFKKKIKKSQGLISLGYLHTLLPAVPSGAEWYDKNKIYYRIILGDIDAPENELVNLKLFDRKTGMEWYYSDELVIGYKDIFWATTEPSFVLHAETDFETIRATKRSFGLKLLDDKKIYSELPQSKDTKENWYLKVHNGHFFKDELGYKEWSELHKYNNKDVVNQYKERVMKKERYSLKDYKNQLFNPSIGIMSVENEVEYLTPNQVKVPHNKLYIQQGRVELEELTVDGYSETTGTLFRAAQKDWVRNENVKIYIDAANNGNKVEIFEEYPMEVDYEKGTVFFPNENVLGKVYASYEYRNFRIYKRTYKNRRITNELLRHKNHNKEGEVVLLGSKENWLIQPVPILKTTPGKPSESNIIPATSYRIDYDKGHVIFDYEIQEAVYADYGYFDNYELTVKDYDIQNGIFMLGENVSFKDELYAKYAYFENFFEYKGYYNSLFKKFFHLDLNPSVGHYSTLPVTKYINEEKVVEYQQTASSQLLNKVIHIYIVPDSEGGDSIRHCFDAEEWRHIQQANPMYLLLAKVEVKENGTVNDVVVMDSRTRGGGISESLTTREIDSRVQGRQRYWDIGNWDGKAFYRNGVMVIKLPKKILLEYGGNLTSEYVNDTINKYVAFGTYYIIEWE